MSFLSLESILLMTPILFIILPVHEIAHGWVAYRLGDPTAKMAGRLTFNPFRHIDLLGLLMLYTAGFGWAKPVPVNFGNLKNRRSGMILVAMAGPLSNILLALISVIIGGIIAKLADAGVIFMDIEGSLKTLYYISLFFFYFGTVNISLAVFNMIPVPPLDGSRLISAFVPE
ncbi:MAG TPA: site-2 protease family protein, partial [Clostridiaceae bacterium]|nr:site-2 protease family protein [Clostridiaceae bacterium]